MDDKDFFLYSQYAIDSSPENLSQYMYSTLCNGQYVYKHSRGHLQIDTAKITIEQNAP